MKFYEDRDSIVLRWHENFYKVNHLIAYDSRFTIKYRWRQKTRAKPEKREREDLTVLFSWCQENSGSICIQKLQFQKKGPRLSLHVNQPLTKTFESTLVSVCLIAGDHLIKVYLIQDQVWDQINLRILATIYTAHNLNTRVFFRCILGRN